MSEHTHTYTHEHSHGHDGQEHSHEHTHDSYEHDHEGAHNHQHKTPENKEQVKALLDYTYKHNTSHADELKSFPRSLRALEMRMQQRRLMRQKSFLQKAMRLLKRLWTCCDRGKRNNGGTKVCVYPLPIEIQILTKSLWSTSAPSILTERM
ncbi:MAG: hypothetical protein IJU77_09350 [Butyrivibrio sp.]|nr:hypothetical protein [Butyrivibrio sp.]